MGCTHYDTPIECVKELEGGKVSPERDAMMFNKQQSSSLQTGKEKCFPGGRGVGWSGGGSCLISMCFSEGMDQTTVGRVGLHSGGVFPAYSGQKQLRGDPCLKGGGTKIKILDT